MGEMARLLEKVRGAFQLLRIALTSTQNETDAPAEEKRRAALFRSCDLNLAARLGRRRRTSPTLREQEVVNSDVSVFQSGELLIFPSVRREGV
jgi:hypothetical protein